MRNILLSSAAFLVLSTGLTFAGVGSAFNPSPTVEMKLDSNMLLVKKGSGGDDSGSDDNGGDNDSHDSDDNDNDASNSNDDNQDVSGSNRRKPRVKGGSGCDSAGDIAEHAACQ